MSAGQLINASPPGDSQIRSDWIGLDCLKLFFFLFFIFGLEWGALGSLADRRVPIPAHSIRFASVRLVYRKTNTWPGTRRWPFAVRYVTHGWLSGS